MKRICLMVAAASALFAIVSCQQGNSKPAGQSQAAAPASTKAAPISKEGRSFTWTVASIPKTVMAGSTVALTVAIKNTSPLSWQGDVLKGTNQPLRLGYHWLDATGKRLPDDSRRAEIPFQVPSGGEAAIVIQAKIPLVPGQYRFEPDVVQEFVAWFGDYLPVRQPGVPVEVVKAR